MIFCLIFVILIFCFTKYDFLCPTSFFCFGGILNFRAPPRQQIKFWTRVESVEDWSHQEYLVGRRRHDWDDSRTERGDITRTSGSSFPPPERRVARGDLPAWVTKDSQNQETSDSKTKINMLRDLVLVVLVFSVGFGCGFGQHGASQPTPNDP